MLTYNVWCRHGDWSARHSVLRGALRELAPDLAVLQETVVQDGYDQVVDLLGDGYQVVHQQGRTPDGVGASIASRWPIENVRQELLHVSPRVNAEEPWIGSVALADITAPAPYGRLLLVHFKPSWQFDLAYERELQAVAAARMVEAAVAAGGPDHVLLAGDFDAAPDSSMIRFWTGRQSLGDFSVCYRDAWEHVHHMADGHTFVPGNPLQASGEIRQELGRRIDYVLVRADGWGPTLAVTDCSRFLDQPVGGVWASDHFGVAADLAPAGQARARHLTSPAAAQL
jgi:endonuclease/exonuclease/phosphatase family metal-dependent hydrolase